MKTMKVGELREAIALMSPELEICVRLRNDEEGDTICGGLISATVEHGCADTPALLLDADQLAESDVNEFGECDLEECADCGGSTGEGTASPHECINAGLVDPVFLANIAAELEALEASDPAIKAAGAKVDGLEATLKNAAAAAKFVDELCTFRSLPEAEPIVASTPADLEAAFGSQGETVDQETGEVLQHLFEVTFVIRATSTQDATEQADRYLDGADWTLRCGLPDAGEAGLPMAVPVPRLHEDRLARLAELEEKVRSLTMINAELAQRLVGLEVRTKAQDDELTAFRMML